MANVARFDAKKLPDQASLARTLQEDGVLIVENVLDKAFVASYTEALEQAIADHHQKWGSHSPRDYAMVLICSLYPGPLISLLENPHLFAPFDAVLGDNSIVYAYTSSSMPPSDTNYSSRLHVDSPRLVPGYVTNMGATILLTDFTEQNGATWYLPKSYNLAQPPGRDEFFAKAARVIAPAGSVFYFNARIWHAGGMNSTPQWRHATTINMCRQYMKQRIDLPRAMAHLDLSAYKDIVKKKLGFYCQPPASIEEFYLPPDKRPFRQVPE